MTMTDEKSAAQRPLVEACRPKGKTPPRDLRRTLEAIIWRRRNGAAWRAIPTEFGSWWAAAQKGSHQLEFGHFPVWAGFTHDHVSKES
jgi:transposase